MSTRCVTLPTAARCRGATTADWLAFAQFYSPARPYQWWSEYEFSTYDI